MIPTTAQLDVLTLQLIIKEMFNKHKNGYELDRYDKELLENLACVVEHHEKQIYVNY